MTKKQTNNTSHIVQFGSLVKHVSIFAQLLYFSITLRWLFFPCVRSTPAFSLPVYLHHCPSSILGKYTI